MSGRTTYTFSSITFTRQAGDEVVPWFYPDGAYTKDPVLYGTKVYVDVGASTYPPMSFRATCASSADRSALIAALWTSGTLSNSRGHSGTALLVKAIPINTGIYAATWAVDVAFEYLPS